MIRDSYHVPDEICLDCTCTMIVYLCSPNDKCKDPANYPDASIDDAKNYCRNPDDSPAGKGFSI